MPRHINQVRENTAKKEQPETAQFDLLLMGMETLINMEGFSDKHIQRVFNSRFPLEMSGAKH